MDVDHILEYTSMFVLLFYANYIDNYAFFIINSQSSTNGQTKSVKKVI